MLLSSVKKIYINQHSSEGEVWRSQGHDDKVIVEEPLEVWIQVLSGSMQAGEQNFQPLLTLMRTPGDDINLVTGWLLSSGLIASSNQIKAIHHSGTERIKHGSSNRILVTVVSQNALDLSPFKRQEYASSACGVCGQQSIETILLHLEKKRLQQQRTRPGLQASEIPVLASQLSHKLPLFEQTGGNHGVALFSHDQGLIDWREDVGRHNALDKLIGANAALLQSPAIHVGYGVILSGRVGFELMQKAAMADIDYVLALGAPSSLAVELAKETDMLLVGFIKAQHFNVYCGEHLLV